MTLCVCYSKAFDIDMSPLSFGAEDLYQFISERFEETSAPVQEQCLEWLQVSAKRLLLCSGQNCSVNDFKLVIVLFVPYVCE